MCQQVSIVGTTAVFVVSDPWEFESENRTAEIRGMVTAVSGDSVLLTADHPVTLRGQTYDAVVCRPRYEKDSVDSIASGAVITCNAFLLSPDQITSPHPFDFRGWRGGGALTGSLSRS
jgi:hypothetical protein